MHLVVLLAQAVLGRGHSLSYQRFRPTGGCLSEWIRRHSVTPRERERDEQDGHSRALSGANMCVCLPFFIIVVAANMH